MENLMTPDAMRLSRTLRLVLVGSKSASHLEALLNVYRSGVRVSDSSKRTYR